MTAITRKPEDPTAHLIEEDVEQIGVELDAIRQQVIEARGERDAAYIRRVIDTQRKLELSARALLLAGAYPPAWFVGTVALSLAKILENMEIGHNVMHGQWDWMRDPKIHSTTWEWDNASPSEGWQHSHNQVHHTYTNIVGMDNDLGFGIMRVDEDQRWHPRHLGQPVWNFLNACIFEYGIAAYDMELGAQVRKGRGSLRRAWQNDADFRARGKGTLRKVRKQFTKDYVVHPALALPFGGALPALAANAAANFARNWWTHSVIMCGHFPEGVETFEKAAIPEGETRGQWYVRQMLGSANISGSRAMHLMTGNLSHQIEHHLFPDLPSNRYVEIAPQIRELFDRYGLNYHSAPLPRQVGSAWRKVVRLSLPNGWLAETTPRNAPQQLAKLWRLSTGGRKVRRQQHREWEQGRQAEVAAEVPVAAA